MSFSVKEFGGEKAKDYLLGFVELCEECTVSCVSYLFRNTGQACFRLYLFPICHFNNIQCSRISFSSKGAKYKKSL